MEPTNQTMPVLRSIANLQNNFDNIKFSAYARDFVTDFHGAKKGRSIGTDLSYTKNFDLPLLESLLVKFSGSLNKTVIDDQMAPGSIGWSAGMMLFKEMQDYNAMLNIKGQEGFYYINIHTGERTKMPPSVYLDASVTRTFDFFKGKLDLSLIVYNALYIWNHNLVGYLAQWTSPDGQLQTSRMPWLANLSLKFTRDNW